MEDFDLEVIISNANTVNVNSITFKIGKNGSWWDLQYGASIYCNIPARKPGYYKLKASVNFDSGKCLETTEKNIEVTFPDVSEIQSDATVSEAMNTVWAQTKSAASPSGRSERRFWIYANTTGSNLTFETDTYDTGPINTSCEPGTGSSVSAGNPIDTQGTPTAGGRYYVALFHTHTPLTYCSSSAARPTGPSENDNLYVSTGGGLPGLVYDYNATIIQGGHNINAPSRIYIFGSNKRRTPYF
jgi:hypothetical protein